MRLTYVVPPLDANGETVAKSFVEMPPVVEAALLAKDGSMLPGLILDPDMAVTLTWQQAADLHRLLGDWLIYSRWRANGCESKTFRGAIVGSKELVES